ncbi:hypothetical protein E1B28_007710 [Marasmius oreades]|uniref:Thioesterase domain-containing protein n=1 Tax=Marasmius oreades TaxID=181124 RepID=A0A9P7S2F9_9AGAR|nr:uncharacterized protein E1B28_007710 [Marasmius oreades]KAG7094092.1 hypothetical protein E1B28_007710 [Marasmius oreades]
MSNAEPTSQFMVDPSPEDELANQQIKWPRVPPAKEVIVKLRNIPGQIPLIMLHGPSLVSILTIDTHSHTRTTGGGGNIHSFGPLQKKFHSSIWAIQSTPDTPLTSIHAQAEFYVKKMREEQPRGPYRLAAFSATAITLLEMVHIIEESGEKIIQLVFIDHFPTVFFAPPMGLDIDLSVMSRDQVRAQFVEKNYFFVCHLLRKDSGGKVVRRHKLADGLTEAWKRIPVDPFLRNFGDFLEVFLSAVYDFLEEITTRDRVRSPDMGALSRWLRQLNCPVTVFLADKGIHSCIPAHAQQEWEDIGIRRGFPGAEIRVLDAGHYDILSNDVLVYELQKNFYPQLRASL